MVARLALYRYPRSSGTVHSINYSCGNNKCSLQTGSNPMHIAFISKLSNVIINVHIVTYTIALVNYITCEVNAF